MTEEAREAAIAAEREKFMDPPATSLALANAHLTGFCLGWDAGVREGIRQAREAVAGEDLFDDTGDDFDGAYKAAIDDALRAIDALEAEK